MRLFLASQDFGRHADKLHELVGANKKALIIMNARDHYSRWYMFWKTREKLNLFRRNGFSVKVLDLREYFNQPEKLRKFINNYKPNLIYAFGGDVFTLRRAMKQSGFDEILKQDLADDKYVFAGGSAGSMILSPNLKYYQRPNQHDPARKIQKYNDKITEHGLGLVDFYIIPHTGKLWHKNIGDEIRKNLTQERKEKLRKNHEKFYELTDDDVIIIDGERLKFWQSKIRGKLFQ